MKTRFIVLLAVFATACADVAPPQRFEAKIDEPPAEERPVVLKPSSAPVVSLHKDGTVHLAGKKVGTVDNLAQLEKEIAAGFERTAAEGKEEPKTVFIKAARSVKYGHMVIVIDKLKSIGAGPIGLQIDDLEE